jgi:flavin reductase (DIM6/NTAB) family NADH-FMN oxidoreductase RutF
MTFDPESFRRAMRAWTTGVAIILATHENESYGMTINSFTSLSVDPPLITVVLKNETHVFDLVQRASAFRIHILSAAQKELAENFAGKLHGAERMNSLTMESSSAAASTLDAGLASLACRVIHTYAAGANTLFVAEVVSTNVRSTEEPLAYHDRGYRQIKN